MKILHMITFILVIIGALNWGAVGMFQTDVVKWLLGEGSLANLVYILIGVSGVYLALTHMNDCKVCAMKKGK